MPKAKQVIHFHCVTGWIVDDVRWTGVRIHDLLAAAGPLPPAAALAFVSAERPYVDSLTLDQVLLPDVCSPGRWTLGHSPRPHGGLSGS